MIRGKLYYIEWDLISQNGWYKSQVNKLMPWLRVWS
jgi:hypothetical protein